MSEKNMADPTAPAGRGILRDRPQSSRFVQGVFRPREDVPVARFEIEPPPPPAPAGEGGVQDLLKAYLRDVSRHNLLSREGEVAVAQRIEASKVTLLVGVLSCKVALPVVEGWLRALDEGTMTGSDFFAPDPPVVEDEEAAAIDPALDDTPLPDLPIPEEIPADEEPDPDKVRTVILNLREHLEGVAGGSKKGRRPSGAAAREIAVSLIGEGLEAGRFEELTNAFEDMVKGVSAKVRSCPWQGPVPALVPGARKEGPVGLIVRRLRARGEARPRALLDALAMLAAAGLEPERFGRLAADVSRARRELACAKEEMTSSNLRLVISIARRSKDKGLQFIDLVQEGNIGLMRAVDKFDYRRGYKFATYATWWIRQSVTRALADQGRVIRVPVHTYEKLGKIHRLVRAFNAEHGRDPNASELSEASGLPVDQIRRLLQTVPDPVSLDMPMGDEGGATIADVVEDRMSKRPDDILHEGDIRRHILEAMNDLTPREERVLRLRYGINIAEQHTLEQCGEIFGVTRERIRQIEAKALEKLKHPSKARALRNLL